MTIADTHSIKSNGLRMILKDLKDAYNWKETDRIWLYIVIPDDVLDTFTRYQKYTRLKNETEIQKLPTET